MLMVNCSTNYLSVEVKWQDNYKKMFTETLMQMSNLTGE